MATRRGSLLRVRVAAEFAPSPVPPPVRRSVSGFPALADRVENLPLVERIQVRALVDWVIESHQPGGFPVTEINAIGHAHRDDERGRAFELDISQRRARAVSLALADEINRLTLSSVPFTVPSILARIRFVSSGVGSKFAQSANNEVQRSRNRRVTIVFTNSAPPRSPVDVIDPDALKRCLKFGFPGGPRIPRIPQFLDMTFPTRDEYREIVRLLRSSPLRFVDIKPAIHSVVDALDVPKDDEDAVERHLERATDAIIEDEIARRRRSLDPPGDPDHESQVNA